MKFPQKSSFPAKIPLLLAAIFALGLFLRLYKLGFQNFWGDEYFLSFIAKKGNIWQTCLHLNIPPLYIFLQHGWLKFFPITEITTRFWGALIGALSILLFYFLGQKLFNKNVGLLSAFFLSISSLHIYYCQEAKYYPIVIFMAILTHLVYIRLLRHDTLKHYLLYGACLTISVYTHYYFGVFFFIHIIHLLINRKTYKALVSKILLVQCAVMLLLSPVLFHTFSDPRNMADVQAWISMPTVSSVLQTLSSMLGGQNWASENLFFIKEKLVWILYGVLSFLCLLIYRFKQSAWEHVKMPMSFVLLWAFFPFCAFYLFSAIFLPIYETRYILSALLGLYLLLGWSVDQISLFNLGAKIRLSDTTERLIRALFWGIAAGILAYLLWGHWLITEMYTGRSWGFLNRLIESQAVFPLEDYIAKGDRMIHIPVYLALLLSFLLIFFSQSSVLFKRIMLISFFVIINSISLAYYYHHPVRAQFREAAAFVSEHCNPDDKIAVETVSQEEFLFKYYFTRGKSKGKIVTIDGRITDADARLYSWIVLFHREMPQKNSIRLAKQFSEINIYRIEK